jgi:hypothetical protein
MKSKTRSESLKKYFREHPSWNAFTKTKEYRNKMSIATSGKKNGMFGRKQSEETKEKIRKKQYHIWSNREYRKKMSILAMEVSKKRWENKEYKEKQRKAISKGLTGRTFSDTHRENLSKSLKGMIPWNLGFGDYIKGSRNPMWKGGISIKYPDEFNYQLQEFVRNRDNNVCQMCFKIQKKHKLSVHHIDENKMNNNINNLVSLCKSCHQRLHASKMLFANSKVEISSSHR